MRSNFNNSHTEPTDRLIESISDEEMIRQGCRLSTRAIGSGKWTVGPSCCLILQKSETWLQQQERRCCAIFPSRKSPATRLFQRNSVAPRGGLFSIDGLHKPSDFVALATDAKSVCDGLRSSLTSLEAITSKEHASETLKRLDNVSKTVCNVIDAAELCRSVHSSVAWREASSKAFAIMSDYIALLNSDTHLYRALSMVTNSDYFPQLSQEEQRFAILLKAEFERDGIHLPDEERNKVRTLQNHVTQLETLFTDNITHSRKYFDVDAAWVEEIIPRHILEAHVPQSNKDRGKLTLSTDAHIANTLTKFSSNPALRKEVYMESHTACPENLAVLDSLIQRRHEVATQQGFESYADRFLRDKMAKDQQNVFDFLNTLRQKIDARGTYRRDMEALSRAKQKIEGNGEIEAWDIPFYTSVIKARDGFDASEVSSYLTLGNCVEAMTTLVDRLFGISMKEDSMDDEEKWDVGDDGSHLGGKVRKFVFHDENRRPLGTMYLDLHPREGKYGHAAHFTVRCGCVIGGGPSERRGDEEYQLPIVALVCNMSSPSSSSILSHSEVETLFHEFGHALHSLLSRTTFQHLSGTRGAMDFVETPSHLFEQYAWDPTFLKVFARHHHSGEPIPDDLIHKLVQSRNEFRSIDIQNQILYALFDQTIFGIPDPSQPSTTQVFAKYHKDLGVPYAEGTHWHSRFGHLVTYGAGYYGYLYAQVFAGDIWNKCLAQNPLSRTSGKEIWQNMLVHGGAKDPNEMLATILKREPSVDSFLKSLEI